MPRSSKGATNQATRAIAGASVAALIAAPLFTQGPAAAIPVPLPPTDPAVAEHWVNSSLRQLDAHSPLGARIDAASTRTLKLGDSMQVPITLTNNGSEAITNISVTARTAGATASVSDAHHAAAADISAFGNVGTTQNFDVHLEPHQSTQLLVPVDSGSGAKHTRGITQAGVIPLAFAIAGSETASAATKPLASPRMLLPVDQPGAADALGGTEQNRTKASPGLSVLWPITARTNVIPGETGQAPGEAPLILRNDELGSELVDGGRLDTLLDTYLSVLNDPKRDQLKQAACLALDPQLVETVDRMSRGYSVAAERPSPVAHTTRLRDSFLAHTPEPAQVPGSSVTSAGEWIRKLSNAAKSGCVVSLPWGNANLDALGQTGNSYLMGEAVSRGELVLSRVLGAKPLDNVVIPGTGYISESTALALTLADAHVARTSPAARFEQALQGSAVGPDSAPVQAPAPAPAPDQPAAPGPNPAPAVEKSETAAPGPAEGPMANHQPAQTPTQAPANEVRVLVADNTVWGAPKADRFAKLAPGVTAVTFPSDLASTTAQMGASPATTAYSDPNLRYDYALDSEQARTENAISGIRLAVRRAAASLPAPTELSREPIEAVAENAGGARERTQQRPAADSAPVLITPPADLASADGAQALMDTAQQLLDSGSARPVTLKDYLTPSARQSKELDQAVDANGGPATSPDRAQSAAGAQGSPGGTAPKGSSSQGGTQAFGAPYQDPAAITDTEVLRATQQATYTDDLTTLAVNDPKIALTRYGFTEPLRQDLLRALSVSGRRNYHEHADITKQADQILNGNRAMLQELRGSVELIPPGNVYTRTSDSSPLPILARNGLPLPVRAQLKYDGPTGAKISVAEDLLIPAKGSITTNMTGQLPQGSDHTRLHVWLASMTGAAISTPVVINVQTRTGIWSGVALVVVILGMLALLGARWIAQRRKQERSRADAQLPGVDTPAPRGTARPVSRETLVED